MVKLKEDVEEGGRLHLGGETSENGQRWTTIMCAVQQGREEGGRQSYPMLIGAGYYQVTGK